MKRELMVIGGGLAGCEAAYQAARLGVAVHLYEMRPGKMTPAHAGEQLAELICSNSLGSDGLDRAAGVLKAELRQAGSMLMAAADQQRVPAGSALAVDRGGFSAEVTRRILEHPLITLHREEVTTLPEEGPVVVASGPLTSPALAETLIGLTGTEALFFFDAIAPIVELDSIDFNLAFRASRYGHGEEEEGDYINCPMDEAEYRRFYEALINAERIELRDFERQEAQFFEACLPVEILAGRGEQALAFGPLRPVGLTDPRTGHRPHAVVQLRQDNAAGTLYNLVGFQTNLKYGEQDRVLRLIPGLEQAHFVRYGSMHRNTYLNAPRLLAPTLQLQARPDLIFAGQIAGLEGYAGNIAGGWLAGINAARLILGQELVVPPPETMVGALIHYITHAEAKNFQPMKANFGLMPELTQRIRSKRDRGAAYSKRALAAMTKWLVDLALPEV